MAGQRTGTAHNGTTPGHRPISVMGDARRRDWSRVSAVARRCRTSRGATLTRETRRSLLGHWGGVDRYRCEPNRWSDLPELSPAASGNLAQRTGRRCRYAGGGANTDLGRLLRIVRVDSRRDSRTTVSAELRGARQPGGGESSGCLDARRTVSASLSRTHRGDHHGWLYSRSVDRVDQHNGSSRSCQTSSIAWPGPPGHALAGRARTARTHNGARDHADTLGRGLHG